MHITELGIQDFRCFSQIKLTPGPGINLIVGDNASGKSSLLEAIFYLGRGRSFRRTAASRVIRHGAKKFVLTANLQSNTRRAIQLGIERDPGSQRLKVGNQANAGVYDLVSALPLQIIDPNLHRLLEDGPEYRRRYLDWGVFHVEQNFYPAWRRYRRALRQRNSALRNGLPKTAVIAWDAELLNAALDVDACRRGYVDALSKLMPSMVGKVLGDGEVVLDYQPGWPKGEDLGGALMQGLEGDQKAGFTRVGPHRADLRVRVDSLVAKDWVSRGQQKVITAVLLLAQATLLHSQRGINPLLLIDDLAAELGSSYRRALIDAVQQLEGQCFLSFLDKSLVPSDLKSPTMFHVEHGSVNQVEG